MGGWAFGPPGALRARYSLGRYATWPSANAPVALPRPRSAPPKRSR